MASMRCKNCGHSADAHTRSVTNHLGDCVVCGCTRLKLPDASAREARQRDWVATAEFFTTKKGWVKAEDIRVKAMGHGGALMRAVREGKRLVLKPRQRVAQVRVTLTPIPRRRGGVR